VIELSRRVFLAAGGSALTATSGCLFGIAHRGRADAVSAQLSNDTESDRTVTVRLVTGRGKTELAETYDMARDGTAEFEVQDPAREYTLSVDTSDGVTGGTEWDVSPCSNYVHVSVGGEAVEFQFTKC
jgi:hypothetical protein